MKNFLKAFWKGVKNTLLIVSVFFISYLFVEIKVPMNVRKEYGDSDFILFSIALTIIIIYVWKKIDKRFFK